MEEALLSIGLLIVIAKIGEGVALRLHLSAMAAYVTAGIVLGPILGIVEPSPELEVFFGVGIIFLFFLVGVDEVDISRFAETVRGRFFLASAIAFLVPMALSIPVTIYLLDLSTPAAIAISGIIALSSLGVAAKVLSDLNHLKEPLGLEIFTTVVMVELMGLLLVGFALQELEDPGDFSPWLILRLLGQIVAFAVIAWLLASHLFPPMVLRLRRWISASQLSFGILVGALFLVAVGAEKIGLHASLGALLFGTALSGLPQRLRMEVMPGIRSLASGLFIPLFFASAGLHLQLSFSSLSALDATAICVVAVLGKAAGSALGPRLARLTNPFGIASGLMAKGVVEIALLLTIRESGAISPDLFSLLTIIMLSYIFIGPLIIGSAVNRAKTAGDPTVPSSIPPSYGRYALDNLTVGDLLDNSRQFATEEMLVTDFMERWVIPEQRDYVVVRSEERRIAGVFSLHNLQSVPKARWDITTLGQVARLSYPTVGPDDPLDDVLERMPDGFLTSVPVIDPGTGAFLGSITSRDIMASIVGGEGKAH